MRIGENGITAYQSGYIELSPLRVTSNNQDVISFPHKYLTEIVTFTEECFGLKVCHRMGNSSMFPVNDILSKLFEGIYFPFSTLIPVSFYISRNRVLNKWYWVTTNIHWNLKHHLLSKNLKGLYRKVSQIYIKRNRGMRNKIFPVKEVI